MKTLQMAGRATGATGGLFRTASVGRPCESFLLPRVHQRLPRLSSPNLWMVGARSLTTFRNPHDASGLQDDAFIRQPSQHLTTIIWLHGLGDQKESFATFISNELHQDTLRSRIIIPNAPYRPITINGGMTSRAWYDIFMLDRLAYREDEKGIEESSNALKQLLDAECKLINSTRIFLCGFSQGGAMSIHTGLNYHHPLGGILCLSGYVLQPQKYPQHIHPANLKTPVYMYHGSEDDVVPVSFARNGANLLQSNGVKANFMEEEQLGHYISVAETGTIAQIFRRKNKELCEAYGLTPPR